MGKHKKDPNLAVINSLTDEQREKMWEIYDQMAEFEFSCTRRSIWKSQRLSNQWNAMNDKLTAIHPSLHYDLIKYVIEIWGEDYIRQPTQSKKAMENQPSILGTATDQNTFQSEMWGTLQFFPTKTDKWVDNCRHCLLWTREQGQTDECLRAPCNPDERDDHRRGYYSIHQMPSQSKN